MFTFVVLIIQILAVFLLAAHLAAFCVWVERKGSALIQDRIGANRAGAFIYTENILPDAVVVWLRKAGLFKLVEILMFPVLAFVRINGVLGVINTLVCDAVKAILKEDFVPSGTSQFVHSLAPFMAVLPVFLAFAVIPFSPDFVIFGETIRTQVAPLNVGVLFILGMASIAVYGVTIAGWCGNNKFALLGSLRTCAQMISYELALGITLVSMILTFGTVDLYQMVVQQSSGLWGVLLQPISFVIFFASGMAETKRAPFDLPEAESELVAGYFTEYSGMKFLLFWLGEFAEIALLALLISVIFLGGWHMPGLDLVLGAIRSWSADGVLSWALAPGSWVYALIGFSILMAKTLFLCVLQIVIRWTLPRFRFDQLMTLGWKMLLPISMVNLLITAFIKLI